MIPTKKQMSYFNASLAISEQSNHQHSKHGCVVVDKHRIISSGANSITRCSPIQRSIDYKRFGGEHRGVVHAETCAMLPLIKQGYDMSGCDVYVSRRHKNGSLAMSRPCSGCMSLLTACGVRRVFYTVENGYASEKIRTAPQSTTD